MKIFIVVAALFLLVSPQLKAAEGEKMSGKRISDSFKEDMRSAKPAARKAGERFCSRLERELGAKWAALSVSTGSAAGTAADISTPAGQEMKAVELCLKVRKIDNAAAQHDESAVNIPERKDESLAIAARLRRQSAEMEAAAESVYKGDTGGRGRRPARSGEKTEQKPELNTGQVSQEAAQ